MIDTAIQQEEEQRKLREDMATKEAAITQGLQAANQAAAAHLQTEVKSERERSPRRRQHLEGAASKQAEAAKPAPWQGPTCSLMGDVGPERRDSVPGHFWQHSVEAEYDYVEPRFATILGLRRAYEVELLNLGIHTSFGV